MLFQSCPSKLDNGSPKESITPNYHVDHIEENLDHSIDEGNQGYDQEEYHEQRDESFLDHQDEHISDLEDDLGREHGEDHAKDDTLTSEGFPPFHG